MRTLAFYSIRMKREAPASSLFQMQRLFPRIPEPTECTGSMSIAAFTELYLPYLAAQKLPLKPCPIPALLRLQENQQYDW